MVGRPPGKKGTDLEDMWANHKEICRRLVLGEKPKQIALMLSITPQTVSNIRNSHIAKEYMATLLSLRDGGTIDIAEDLQDISPQALLVLREILSDGDAPIAERARTARDLLDRGGWGAVQKISHLHAHLSEKDIEKLKERSRKYAEEAGVLARKRKNGDGEVMEIEAEIVSKKEKEAV